MNPKPLPSLWTATAGLSWLAPLAVLTVSGCAQFLGVDFSVSHEGDAGRDGPACGPLQAPNEKGICLTVGVPPDGCGAAFAWDKGGCTALLPTNECVSHSGTSWSGPNEPWQAIPGQRACANPDPCGGDSPAPAPDAKTARYAGNPVLPRSGAPGTQYNPYPTIKQALDDKPDFVLLYAGDFAEGPLVIRNKVWIRGTCQARTRISGTSSAPTITFGAGSDGSELQLVEVAGHTKGTALAISGASGVTCDGIWIHDVADGITVEDAVKTPWVALSDILIERPAEHGIVIRGSSVHVGGLGVTQGTTWGVVVRDVGSPMSPPSPAVESAGIAIHPSRHARPINAPGWGPAFSLRSNVTIEGSLVERADIGILAEGSKVAIGASVIRDSRLGVVDRWRPIGHMPGNLDIKQSTIEGSREIGLEIWNAHASVDETTIRTSGAAYPPADVPMPRPIGAYPGNAVRARYDHITCGGPLCDQQTADAGPEPEAVDQSVTIARSLIDGTTQAALQVEGGALTLDRTLVQGSAREAYTRKLGDGVVAYGYDHLPASVTFQSARISGSERAGVVSFGATISLQGAAIEGAAGAIGIISDTAVNIDGVATCKAGTTWSPCVRVVDPSLDRSVVAANCGPGAKALDCTRYCFDPLGQTGVSIKRGTVEFLRDPRIAPAVTDDLGCAELGGVEEGHPYEVGFFHDYYVPTDGPRQFQQGPSASLRSRADILSYDLMGAGVNGWFGFTEYDLADAAFALYACQGPRPPSGSSLATLNDACPKGMEGWTVEITPAVPVDGPFYSGLDNFPASGHPSALGGNVFFANLPPNDYEFVLHPPVGKSGTCSAEFFSSGVSSAWPSSDPLRFKFRAEAGFVGGAYVYCTEQ
jgi:hypothetical protein